MVNNVIHGTYTETYDVNTIQDELSILAIHTPQAPSLKRMFHGFFEQYSKFKILGCNFKMVCATRQDLDPTLAGSGTGQIDPRNVLNPILFKACTGEHINALCDQIYNKTEEQQVGTYGGSVSQHIVNGTDATLAINSYYSLLADDSWRKEHPQRGITVMGLKPMVHKVVTTQPFKWNVSDKSSGVSGADGNPAIGDPASNGNDRVGGFGGISGSKDFTTDPVNPTVFVSNGMTEMPWLPTSYSKVSTYVDGSGASQGQDKNEILISNIPRVYMGCLVLPPAIGGTGNLYFRIQIVWHILFKDFRPVQDILAVAPAAAINSDDQGVYQDGLADYNRTYWNMYHSSSKLSQDYGSFDTAGIDNVTEVNEKVN